MARAARAKALRRGLALLVGVCVLVFVATAAAVEEPSSETVAIGDATNVAEGKIVSVSEGIGVGDGTAVVEGAAVAVSEGVGVGDGTAVVPGQLLQVAEGVGIADGTETRLGQTVELEEGIAIGDGTSAVAQNVVPSVQVGAMTGSEGTAVTGTGSFVDPDASQEWTATVDYGDGSGVEPLVLAADKSFQLEHVYDDNGAYVVTVVVHDSAGGSGTATGAVTIATVAPTATLANGGPADEGASVEISFAGQHDPSGADTDAGFRYRYACDGTTLGPLTPSASALCSFDDDGTFTVLARILDKDGGHTDYTTAVEIGNVPPTATLANDGPSAEGGAVTISFTEPRDPSPADGAAGFRYHYACDGVALLGPTLSPTTQCTFDDGPSDHTVLARIEDKDGGFTDYTTVVHVENVDPDGTLANDGPVSEGSAATVGWSGQSDPSQADTETGFGYRYACDGATLGPETTSPETTCTFDDGPASHVVLARILDQDGGFTDHTTVVMVENEAPTATLVVPTTDTNEGSAFTLELQSPADPSTADAAAGFLLEYDCGAGYQASPTCTAVDDPTQAVRARITDKDGGSSEYEATVPIANVEPSVTITGPPSGAVYQIGDPVSFTGTFTDPGVVDTHTATWDLDGTTAAGAVSESGGSGSISLATSFAAPGIYSIGLTVTDDDGGATTSTTVGGARAFVVVYDPTIGSVNGGGWFDSPAGALTSAPSAAGKAIFNLNARRDPGDPAPTGSTEVRFNAARFVFSSTSYSWFVVAGSNAQYSGAGTVNGVPGYTFTVTAYDGTPDRIRLKVWDAAGALVYDNVPGAPDDLDTANPQPLGAGEIIVHR